MRTMYLDAENMTVRTAVSVTRWGIAVLLVGALLLSGCTTWQTNDVLDRIVPTNDRAWVADMQRLSTAEIQGEEILVKNIRNCQYVTANDYVVNYYDRRIQLKDLRTVDFIVVPFRTKALAHTMLSFGLADGTYLTVSVEIRKELGEDCHSAADTFPGCRSLCLSNSRDSGERPRAVFGRDAAGKSVGG